MTVRSDPVDTHLRRLTAAIRGIGVGRDLLTDAALIELAERHGLAPLLAERLGEAGVLDLESPLAVSVRRAAAADAVREADLRRVLAALGDRGVPCVLFKGAHLAHAIYPRPDLRPRTDSDLLVRPQDREAAHDALIACGCARVPQFTGELVAYQAPYVSARQGRVAHIIDLHWRLANPQQFGAVLSAGELIAEAVDLPALGDGVKAASPVHALTIACVHPVAHHRAGDMLIWTYDVHLLAERLTAGEWRRYTAQARERGIGCVSAHSLSLAVDAFGTRVPAGVLEALRESPEAEPTARYLARDRRHIQTVLADFQSLGTWRDRLRLVQQHAFPPREYMRRVYAPESAQPLVVLYARRMYRGARKWLARG